MKLAIMQPYFMPYIGYFQLIKAVDKFVIYDDVNYINRGWINRNNILVNGKEHLFSISLGKASQNKLINEISIIDDFKKFMRMVEMAYKKAPYFDAVYGLLDEIINFTNRQLAVFLQNSLLKISDYLRIETEFVLSSSIGKDNSLRGQEKILEICKLLNATTYINPIGGQSLYDKNCFKLEGIELYFIQPRFSQYKQFGSGFIGGLSIIDVMMFNSVEKINQMLDDYILI